jgi:hypothetical protein
MKRRALLGTGALILGWSRAGLAQDVAKSEPPAVIFRLAKPASTTFLRVETQVAKNAEVVGLDRLMWCRANEYERAADKLRLREAVMITAGTDPGDPADLQVMSMTETVLATANIKAPKMLEGHGMVHEVWLAQAADLVMGRDASWTKRVSALPREGCEDRGSGEG